MVTEENKSSGKMNPSRGQRSRNTAEVYRPCQNTDFPWPYKDLFLEPRMEGVYDGFVDSKLHFFDICNEEEVPLVIGISVVCLTLLSCGIVLRGSWWCLVGADRIGFW